MKVAHFERTTQNPFEFGGLSVSIDSCDNLMISGSTEGEHHLEGLSGDGLEYDLSLGDSGSLLVVGETSDRISRINLESGRVDTFPLNRNERDDPDYFRQRFVETSSGVLFVYEGGMLFFDPHLEPLWEKHHKRLDWFFQKVDKQRVVYESEHEGRWSYDLATGDRLES